MQGFGNITAARSLQKREETLSTGCPSASASFPSVQLSSFSSLCFPHPSFLAGVKVHPPPTILQHCVGIIRQFAPCFLSYCSYLPRTCPVFLCATQYFVRLNLTVNLHWRCAVTCCHLTRLHSLSSHSYVQQAPCSFLVPRNGAMELKRQRVAFSCQRMP